MCQALCQVLGISKWMRQYLLEKEISTNTSSIPVWFPSRLADDRFLPGGKRFHPQLEESPKCLGTLKVTWGISLRVWSDSPWLDGGEGVEQGEQLSPRGGLCICVCEGDQDGLQGKESILTLTKTLLPTVGPVYLIMSARESSCVCQVDFYPVGMILSCFLFCFEWSISVFCGVDF